MISTIVLVNEEGKFNEKLSLLMNEWKGGLKFTPDAGTRFDIWIYLTVEIVILSGKCQRILIGDVCGNRDFPLTSLNHSFQQDKNQPLRLLLVAPKLSNSQLHSVAEKETLPGNTRRSSVRRLAARVNIHSIY